VAGELTKKGRTIMNSYEASDVYNVGNAHEVILGQKVIDPLSEDSELGQGFRTVDADIDEGDE
jgi:hypothetical protein